MRRFAPLVMEESTPLITASRGGDLDVVRFLCDAGAGKDKEEDSKNPPSRRGEGDTWKGSFLCARPVGEMMTQVRHREGG